METRKVYVIRIDMRGDRLFYKVMTSILGVKNVKSRVKRMIPAGCELTIIGIIEELPGHILNINKRLYKAGCRFMVNMLIKAPEGLGDEDIIELVMG